MSKLNGAAYHFGVYSEVFTLLFDILGSTSSDLFSAFLSSASAISSGWCNSPLAVGDLPFSVPAQPSTVSSSEKQLQLPLPYPLSSMTLRLTIQGCLLLSSPTELSRREFFINPAGVIALCKFLVRMQPEGEFDCIDQLTVIKEGMKELDAYEKAVGFVPVSHRSSKTVQSAPKSIPRPANDCTRECEQRNTLASGFSLASGFLIFHSRVPSHSE
ncbi:hypothetical protein PRIPAC_76006 [Pristionchus pacificus]|uniref:Uncharacterized protein n=1 Tax=Pristionchus pacificus TaxID=54126 RepID=A0A2A6BEW0_PRIPA|nr:hypothetical protein PRIPAC_76006 [Pristionchus pacificus]|eukprot:PDM64417.1 hypothetical protein PRIPAC_52673 [Pristionchus pacificus]